jgi:hypothetical protein
VIDIDIGAAAAAGDLYTNGSYEPKSFDDGTTVCESPTDSPKKLQSRTSSFTRAATWVKRAVTPVKTKVERTSEWTRNIDRCPNGYPRLAAFQESDPSFRMCRQFGYLHTRILLYRQAEIQELEKKLQALDDADWSGSAQSRKCLQSRKRDDAQPGAPRRELLFQIDEKLKEYDELVERTRRLSTVPKPSARNFASLYNFIYNKSALVNSECGFMKHGEDFVALVESPEAGWLDELVERILNRVPCRLTDFIFKSTEQYDKTDDPLIHYYSHERIGILVRLTITVLSAVILMVPVFVLFGVPSAKTQVKVLIVLAFTLAFSAAISVFTKAKRHEVFAATAA